jgi:hypothetical protein
MPYNPIHKISIFKLGISPRPLDFSRGACKSSEVTLSLWQPWHLGKHHENIQDGDLTGFNGISWDLMRL